MTDLQAAQITEALKEILAEVKESNKLLGNMSDGQIKDIPNRGTHGFNKGKVGTDSGRYQIEP